MANALYNSARSGFLSGAYDWANDTFGVVLVDSNDYAVNLETHQTMSDVTAVSRVSSLVTLTNTSIQTNGAADADDVTFVAVSGDSIEALILYKDGVDDANRPLIAYIDTATGLPITPNGGDIIVTWDNGTNRIFRL